MADPTYLDGPTEADEEQVDYEARARMGLAWCGHAGDPNDDECLPGCPQGLPAIRAARKGQDVKQ